MRLVASLLLLAATLVLAPPADAQPAADYVVHNANVYTVDADQPQAEAFAVRGDRLVMVGSNDDVLASYPDAEKRNAEGRTIVPGLIDAHVHLMGLGRSLLQANLVGTPSKQAIIDTLKAFASDLPEGAWLQGRGWDQNDWPSAGFPTRQDLDAAFPDRPIYLERVDGHAGWVNTAAIEQTVGMEALEQMDDPEGGSIRRDDEGVPTGILIDAAAGIITSEIPEYSEDRLDEALTRALDQTTRYGLTSVHDAGVTRADVDRYQRFIEEDRFPVRMYAMIAGRGDTFDYFCRKGTIASGDRLRVQSVKMYMDGALGSRGAALLEDYSDDAGNRGLLMTQPDEMRKDVIDAIRCGFQVNTHAIGDRGNRVTLDAYEAAFDSLGEGIGRHRVEHAQILHPDDLPRFADMDVIASMQPTHATSDMPWAVDRLGNERLKGAYAWQTLKESGAHLAFGSDFPVEDVDPLEGFHAAVTRQDADDMPEGGWMPEETVSREAALHAFTLGAAYAAFQEQEIGSLEAGKKADFVVLSQDIMAVPDDSILDTRVVATYIDGEAVYATDDWQ
ncbi:amidohydrolase [Longibacter salinarum]|uniref:Amidohydrolase n=1 Tax=Longibacter salinarum TaxID=1850348 RepID=A0A2A8CTY7_9BACT|nr:amidohydrolase [Longibacter salinarum]PEN11295.1 amidohydrolase [Longibacter salinarum]